MLLLNNHDVEGYMNQLFSKKNEDGPLSTGDIIDSFFDRIKANTVNELDCPINCFYDAYMNCINSSLDIRNEHYEKNLKSLRDILQHTDNDAFIPFMMLDAITNDNNNYLVLKQYSNLRRDVGVTSQNLLDALFSLTNSHLIDSNYINNYVRSTSNDVLSSINSTMEFNQGQSENITRNVQDSFHDKTYELVFSDDLSLFKFKDKESNIIDTVKSVRDLAILVNEDIKKLSSENIMNNFYIKDYLCPCMRLYVMKIEFIRTDYIDDPNRLIKMLVDSINLYQKYQHKASKLFIGIILLTVLSCYKNKNYLNIDLNGFMSSSNLEMFDTLNNLTNNGSVNNQTKTDVGTLVRLCNNTFKIIDAEGMYCRPYENGISESARTYVSNAFMASFKIDEPDNSKKVMESVSPLNGSERIGHDESQAITYLNESFKIKKDGTIQIVLKGRTSLMDEYADNHRLLKLNDSNGDTESMKYNLVYAILIIESADRIMHNDKIPKTSKIYKDAEKAKSFANNDIVTYLPKVRISDPNFDLNQFYQKVRADKYTIEVDGVETISGVKKIVQALMV